METRWIRISAFSPNTSTRTSSLNSIDEEIVEVLPPASTQTGAIVARAARMTRTIRSLSFMSRVQFAFGSRMRLKDDLTLSSVVCWFSCGVAE